MRSDLGATQHHHTQYLADGSPANTLLRDALPTPIPAPEICVRGGRDRRSWFRPTPMGTAHLGENRILGALAFGQFRQRLASDQLPEMRGLLMCREGSFVLEHLVEEKFRGLAARSVDHEGLDAWLFPRLRRKAG